MHVAHPAPNPQSPDLTPDNPSSIGQRGCQKSTSPFKGGGYPHEHISILCVFAIVRRIHISTKSCPHRQARKMAYTSEVAHGPCATLKVLGSSVAHLLTPWLLEIEIRTTGVSQYLGFSSNIKRTMSAVSKHHQTCQQAADCTGAIRRAG